MIDKDSWLIAGIALIFMGAALIDVFHGVTGIVMLIAGAIISIAAGVAKTFS